MSTNFEKLLAAGVIIKTPLPKEYRDVIDDLDPAHVDIVVNVKEALESAVPAVAEPSVSEEGVTSPERKFTTYFVF